MEYRRSREPGRGMAFDTDLPQQSTGRSINGVRVSARITEERGVLSRLRVPEAPDANRRAHDHAGVERPVHAAGPRVERVDVARDAPCEKPSADNGDASPRLHIARETKCPL